MALTLCGDGDARAEGGTGSAPTGLGLRPPAGGIGTLTGFVDVGWEGDGRAYVLDPRVAPAHRRRGLASVRRARIALRKAGCEWLPVDAEEALSGFRPTRADL